MPLNRYSAACRLLRYPMNKVQSVFTQIIKNSLLENKNLCEEVSGELQGAEYAELIHLAGIHNISALIYDEFRSLSLCPPAFIQQNETMTLTTVKTSFDLLYISKGIFERLSQNAIPAVIIKGVTAASYYPQPLYRKSGDIDVLISESRLEDSVKVCEEIGYSVKNIQRAHHHVVMGKTGNPDIELHTMLAEPFDDNRVNAILKKRTSELFTDFESDKKHFQIKDIMGMRFTMLSDAYMAYELLLHMLQHYLRSGFGIRLLCDWFFLWNHRECENSVPEYLRLINECGIKGFSDMITCICIRYLGLDVHVAELLDVKTEFTDSELESFYDEFISAGEFGKTSTDRMVSLRGNKLSDYFREFHHQMKLNFPKQSRYFPIWPILWIVTFIRFMVNNKRIRNVKLSSVVIKAGERGKLNSKLKLFSSIK